VLHLKSGLLLISGKSDILKVLFPNLEQNSEYSTKGHSLALVGTACRVILLELESVCPYKP